MPRLLAIDWTTRELRFVSASSRRASIVIEHAGSVPLENAAETILEPASEAAPAAPAVNTAPLGIPATLSTRLQEALAVYRSGRPTVLVGVDRSQVESLEMTLPPADERELPEMVLNQAMRESPAITDDTILDFLPLTDSPNEQRFISAVAMPADRLAAIKNVCDAAGVDPQRILFRPFSSASLFLNHADDRNASKLLVNVIDGAADLSVVAGGKLILTRSVRLPSLSDVLGNAKRIAAEIRRTIVLVPPERLAGSEIGGVVVFGRESEQRELLDTLRSETSLDVAAFDAFSVGEMAEAQVPTDSGRFAPLIGMLADEAASRRHAVDLLNPRKPPKTPSRKRAYIVAGAAAGLLAASALWMGYSEMGEIAETNSGLEKELKELDAEFKKLDKTRQLAGAIDEWEAGSVNWLDELKDLSVRFPPSRDAVVLRMSMSPSRGGGGVVTLQGQARNPAVVETMGQSIRDDAHEIQTPRVQERLTEKSYSWQFETSIFVAGQNDEPKPAERKAEKSSNSKTSAAERESAKTATADAGTTKAAGAP